MKTFDVYLAGAMGGRHIYEITLERCAAKSWCREYGLTFYDPAADEGLDKMNPNERLSTKLDWAVMERFVKKDEANLDKCRYVVNLTGDHMSDGTGWEMARAYYRNKQPIILVAPKRVAHELIGFSSVKATFIANSIDEAIRQVHVLEIIKEHKCHLSKKKSAR